MLNPLKNDNRSFHFILVLVNALILMCHYGCDGSKVKEHTHLDGSTSMKTQQSVSAEAILDSATDQNHLSFQDLRSQVDRRKEGLKQEWTVLSDLISQTHNLVPSQDKLTTDFLKDELVQKFPEINKELEVLYLIELIQNGNLKLGLDRLDRLLSQFAKSNEINQVYLFDVYAQLSRWQPSCKQRRITLDYLIQDSFKTFSQRRELWEIRRLWIQRCAPQKLDQFDREFLLKFPGHPLVRDKWSQFKFDGNELFEYALALEAHQYYTLAQDRLSDLVSLPSSSPQLKSQALYERERIQVKRIRKDTAESQKRLASALLLPKEWGRKARLLAAKVASRKGNKQRARNHYQYLIREWPFSQERHQASFFLAFDYYENHQYRKAVDLFEPLTRHKGNLNQVKRLTGRSSDPYQAQAEWYYAWSLFQFAPTRSAPFLEYQIGKGLPLSEEGRRSAYWASRAWSESKPKKAKVLRQQLIKGNEHDWYTLLLRAQYPHEFPKTAPLVSQLESGLTEAPYVKELRYKWTRLQFLSVLNQSEWVQRYQSQLSESILSSPLIKDTSSRLIWMKRFGLTKEGIRGALRLAPQRRFYVPKAQDFQWWSLLYPKLSSVRLDELIKHTKIHPNEILSFIRKESLFDSYALSPAHAMGLMQMMNRTQVELLKYDPYLKELITPWMSKVQGPSKMNDPTLLFIPQVNVLFGSTYLHHLHTRYHHQLPLIAAAYNAGPHHLQLWVDQAIQHNIKALDLFVELIPFREARNYVKRWTQTYCLYQSVYGVQGINQCALDLPLTLNLNVKEGIQF